MCGLHVMNVMRSSNSTVRSSIIRHANPLEGSYKSAQSLTHTAIKTERERGEEMHHNNNVFGDGISDMLLIHLMYDESIENESNPVTR